MLTVHRRHSRKCSKKNHLPTTELNRCKCALMVMGMDNRGRYHNRESLQTRDLYVGYEVVRKIETGEIIKPDNEERTIERAWEEYKRILVTQRNLKPQSIKALEVVERSMLKFAEQEKVKLFRDINSAFLEKWIGGWDIANSTRIVRRCFLTRMFDAALKRKWIKEDPTLILMRPKSASSTGTTQPFDLDIELPKIMDAIPHWEDGIINNRLHKSVWSARPRIASALLLLLRLTGLRISDAFLFNPRSLTKRVVEGEECYCYFVKQQRKTEKAVFLPFNIDEVRPLLDVEWMSEKWAFWDGVTDLHTWNIRFHQHCLEYLERVSGVDNIHPHRFRDTFAVEFLSQEADIRSVSRLLGHQNVSTTLRYYEHYVKEDQDRLVRVVMNRRRGEGKVVRIREA